MSYLTHQPSDSKNPIKQDPEFIQGFEGNPYARVFCRSFPNKMCSGSCSGCKKELEAFKVTKKKALDSRNNNGDPHFDDIHGTSEEVWEGQMNQIKQAKLAFWERRSEARILAEKVARKIPL